MRLSNPELSDLIKHHIGNDRWVTQLKAGGYRLWEFYRDNLELKAAVDLIDSGVFSHGDKELFRPLTDSLRQHDPFMLCADYQSYVDSQAEVDRAYRDCHHWTRMSILNVARMGKFSSDRSIRDYCRDIWKVEPIEVEKRGASETPASAEALEQAAPPARSTSGLERENP